MCKTLPYLHGECTKDEPERKTTVGPCISWWAPNMRVSLLNSHNFCFSCKAVGAADQSQSSSLFFAALVSHTRPPLLSFLLLPPPALFSPCLLLSPSLLHPLLASSHEVRFANQAFSIISCVFHSLKVTRRMLPLPITVFIYCL